ncbi:unnamed protein product [Rhodiola kirilowii]
MKKSGFNAKGLAELNQLKRVEQINYRDGNSKDGHGLSEEDESRISKDFGDDRCIVLAGTDGKRSPQQPQGSNICWDRFLPTRSIKVMLVENDESTRHIVSALLRNCSYEVTAVANGMEAWKILEGPNIQVDIVLTELTMPGLSGLSLLQKIKDHKMLNNMPVIITSSQDSMGIVFKCLSKGAVDFLVKPIRKNELKNLWQHVWRKLNFSSGSGSGSVKQTKDPAKSLGIEESNNNDSSNIGDDNGSTGLNNRDGSDHGSGTESCWDGGRVEFHCAPPLLPGDQSTYHLSSICAQVICSTTEKCASSWKPATTREVQDTDGDTIMGKDLEMGCRTIATLRHEFPSGKVLKSASDGEKDGTKISQTEMDCVIENDEPSAPAADLMSLIAKNNVGNNEVAFSESPEGNFMAGKTNSKPHASQELPFLELSLKQVGDGGTVATYDHNPLSRSRFSAFTRYSSMATANQTPSGNVGSCSPLDNSSEAAKGESTHDFQSKSSGTLLKQSSNGSTDNTDKGSTTCVAPNNSFKVSNDARTIPFVNSNHSTSAFKRVENHSSHSLPATIPSKANMGAVTVQSKDINQQIHLCQHADNVQLHQKKQKTQDDRTTEEVLNPTPQYQPTNYFNAPKPGVLSVEGMHGVAPGCYAPSGGQTEKLIDINTTDISTDNDRRNVIVSDGGKSLCAVPGITFPSRLDALNKYRQKKKERCFRKKVRYQSRKQLAEQRPRVKGQFVRQAVYNNHAKDQIS